MTHPTYTDIEEIRVCQLTLQFMTAESSVSKAASQALAECDLPTVHVANVWYWARKHNIPLVPPARPCTLCTRKYIPKGRRSSAMYCPDCLKSHCNEARYGITYGVNPNAMSRIEASAGNCLCGKTFTRRSKRNRFCPGCVSKYPVEVRRALHAATLPNYTTCRVCLRLVQLSHNCSTTVKHSRNDCAECRKNYSHHERAVLRYKHGRPPQFCTVCGNPHASNSTCSRCIDLVPTKRRGVLRARNKRRMQTCRYCYGFKHNQDHDCFCTTCLSEKSEDDLFHLTTTEEMRVVASAEEYNKTYSKRHLDPFEMIVVRVFLELGIPISQGAPVRLESSTSVLDDALDMSLLMSLFEST